MPIWRRVAVCGLLALSLQAASAMSIRELRALEKSDSKQGLNYKRYYLVGVLEGALQAHDQGVRAGASATICLNGRRRAQQRRRPVPDRAAPQPGPVRGRYAGVPGAGQCAGHGVPLL